jgi:hypothetical protein
MSRAFAFRTPAQKEARLRQLGACAVCGESLDDVVEHAHHVIPNQSGQRGNPDHAWIASADNCVVLCDLCHDQVHEGGKYRTGGVAPPSYFEHSHGPNRAAHLRWVALLVARTRSVWR